MLVPVLAVAALIIFHAFLFYLLVFIKPKSIKLLASSVLIMITVSILNNIYLEFNDITRKGFLELGSIRVYVETFLFGVSEEFLRLSFLYILILFLKTYKKSEGDSKIIKSLSLITAFIYATVENVVLYYEPVLSVFHALTSGVGLFEEIISSEKIYFFIFAILGIVRFFLHYFLIYFGLCGLVKKRYHFFMIAIFAHGTANGLIAQASLEETFADATMTYLSVSCGSFVVFGALYLWCKRAISDNP